MHYNIATISFAAVPFVLFLGMIAIMPVFYPDFWHRHYPKISIGSAIVGVLYCVFVQKEWMMPCIASIEYAQFLSLIAALYLTTGGIVVRVNHYSTPATNLLFLWVAALLANLIGTTGASMLLIRPYIRFNQGRLAPYQIVFFIFMVSNAGGCLTPMADPPLFTGFLKGIPFTWSLYNHWRPWLTALSLLSLSFYVLEKRNQVSIGMRGLARPVGPLVEVEGIQSIACLALVAGSVLLDPHIFSWIPSLHINGHSISFVRELLFLSIGMVARRNADPDLMEENNFSLAPLKEVALLFLGIFLTMPPALYVINLLVQVHNPKFTPQMLYWGAGVTSAFLDNTPTYLSCLSASMSSWGYNLLSRPDVLAYLQVATTHLKAISLGSVFFGAATYIGNGPNFMVKSIAEREGVSMPSFFEYIFKYTIPLLLPVLAIVAYFCLG